MKKISKIQNRIIALSVIFVLTLVVLLVLDYIMINKSSGKIYEIKGNTSYSVTEKSGNVANNKLYVSQLVDSINVKYNYNFEKSTADNYQYRYVITSNVIAEVDDDTIEEKEVFKKDNILFSSEYTDTKNFKIDKEIKLVYDLYNDVAVKYDNSVNIPIKSKLLLNLDVYIKDENGKEKKYTSYLNLPLEKSTFSISSNNLSIKEESETISLSKTDIIINIVISTIELIIIIFIIKNIVMYYSFKKKNMRDFKYEKIKSDYGDIVVQISKLPNDKDFVFVRVANFKGMIDIQKEIRTPILCYKCPDYVTYMIIKDKLVYIYFLNTNEEKI